MIMTALWFVVLARGIVGVEMVKANIAWNSLAFRRQERAVALLRFPHLPDTLVTL